MSEEITSFLGLCQFRWPLPEPGPDPWDETMHHCMEEEEHEGDHRCPCGERHEKDARRS